MMLNFHIKPNAYTPYMLLVDHANVVSFLQDTAPKKFYSVNPQGVVGINYEWWSTWQGDLMCLFS